MRKRNILLADDDADDRSIMFDAMQLLNAGDVMLFAENGEHALHLLEKQFTEAALPDLIVLDLNMPKLNGTATLSILKEDPRFEDIPVIIYSTSINPLEKEKCLLLGAHSYVTKPISFQESMETAGLFLSVCESQK